MPLLAPVTTTTLSASFEIHGVTLAAKRFSRLAITAGQRLEVRLRLGPILAVAIAEIAQRDLRAVAGQRLEIEIDERAQRPDRGNRRRRVPLEHELLHRPHAVDLAALRCRASLPDSRRRTTARRRRPATARPSRPSAQRSSRCPAVVVHAFQTSATGALIVLVTTMSGASDWASASCGEQREATATTASRNAGAMSHASLPTAKRAS